MALDIADIPDKPRRTALSYYLIYFFVVLPIWSVVPLSYVVTAYYFVAGLATISKVGGSIFAIACSEVIFSLYYFLLKRKVSRPPPSSLSPISDVKLAFARVLKTGLSNLAEDSYDEETLSCERPGSPSESVTQLEFDDVRAAEFRETLRTWFGRCPWSSIRVHEVRQWLYWSVFNTSMPSYEDLPREHKNLLDETVEQLQMRVGMTFPVGSTEGKIQPLRITLDNVDIQWRPFMLYLLTNLLNRCVRLFLQRRRSMRYSSYDGLEYVLHLPGNWNSQTGPRPIVLVHGLGLGLLQYIRLVLDLLRSVGDRPILVLIQPHVSQDIFHPRFLTPMSRHEFTSKLAGLLEQLGWVDAIDSSEEKEVLDTIDKKNGGVTMLSHSNGSCAHTWMLKSFPQLITRSCLVDPVTFSSWGGDMCYNWAYRSCSNGMELVMRYFVGSEVGVANVIQRQFDWTANSLWYEEIPHAQDPRKTLIVVGGQDEITAPSNVKKYLRSHGVRKSLLFYPEYRHGHALASGSEGQLAVLAWLRDESTDEKS